MSPGINKRKTLPIVVFAYVGVVVAFSLFLIVQGEKNVLASLLLFLPPLFLLVPAIVLVPVCLKYRRRLCWLLAALVLFVLFFQMHFRWSFWQDEDKNTLSILTNNIGERRVRTLTPFLKEEAPDIIVLQDAPHRARPLSVEHPGYFVAAQKQFLVLSKYEIKSSGIVPRMMHDGGPVAAWFEIEYLGNPLVIYNIHMPTPRRDLDKMLRRGGIFSKESRDGYRGSLAMRVKLVEQFLKVLQNERRPFVVAGDFNMSDTGWLYRQCRQYMIDAFAVAGRGFGYTFPGVTRNPLTFFGPWLRLDYIFVSADWDPIYCRVEPRQPAQHRGVSVRVRLSKK